MTAEALARTGPLQQWTEHFVRLPETVQVTPEPFAAMIDLRVHPAGSAAAAVAGYLGIDLPNIPSTWGGTDSVRAIWLGPDEWLLTSTSRTPGDLEAGLRDAVGADGAAVDVSGQRVAVQLSGEHARDVLAGGCSIDLHPSVFGKGAAAQTSLGLTTVVLLALDDTGTSYEVHVRSSFAGYLAAWLLDAAIEHQDDRAEQS